MSSEPKSLHCDHCGVELNAIDYPEASDWADQIHWVCFNDDCAYYQEGWEWMWEHFQVRTSYRFRILNPETKRSSPLPVWSKTAIRDRIIEGAQAFRGSAAEPTTPIQEPETK